MKADEVYIQEGGIYLTSWFRTWGVKCGKCKKDFWRFTFFGKPKCPYCGKRNRLNLIWHY